MFRPLDLPHETVEISVTHYGTVSKDKIIMNGSFKIPDFSSSSEKQLWKDTLSEIHELLKAKGLLLF